ncbi:uncharacterized protein LOC112087892 [Eutrema salsugineum]|uniref:uncharacterized protein LOC112087892 n=1 Tax=Eutrema salsugineum TaxID=72664 RepID=UPI000CED3CB6|nr:uncharacterized protein LOC112087892 [Eutrema salsugineum]
MNDGDNIKDFTGKLIDLGNQLRVHVEEKTDDQIVQKILISLPEKFDSIVAVMEQTKDLQTLAVSELIGTLQAHESRVASRYESSTEGAFYEEKKRENKKAKKWCGVCKRNNHNESECWFKQKKNQGGSSQKVVNNERRCFVCNKLGYLAKNCKLRKSERADLSLEETDDEDHMLFSAVEKKISSKIDDETWLVDSGCTNHMTKEVKYFITLDQSIKVPIKVEDDNKCLINDPQGKRILNIKMKHKSFPLRWSNLEASGLLVSAEEAAVSQGKIEQRVDEIDLNVDPLEN